MRILGILFLIICLNSNAQSVSRKTKTIINEVHSIEIAKVNPVDSFNLEFDSISTNVLKFVNKIEATCMFRRSNSKLKVDYYLKNSHLIFVSVQEFSSLKIKGLYHYSSFYFEKGNVISETSRITLLDGAPSFDQLEGYNKNLDTVFLKQFISESYHRIENYR